MLRGAQNSQFRKFPARKPLPKQGENNQVAANSENQIVGKFETTTLDITGEAGELLHSQDQKIEMVTPEGTGIKLEKSELEEVKRTGSVRHTEELDAIVQSRKGSLSHIKNKLTEYKSSDGTFSTTLETETDQIPSQGNEKHTKVKHSITITPSGDKKETREKHTDILLSGGQTLCIDEQETLTRSGSDSQEEFFIKQQSITLFPPSVEHLHVLDLLKIGQTYPINSFTGSVPDLHARALVHYQHIGAWESTTAAPKWAHESCSVKVVKENELGKHLILTAKVNTDPSLTTTPYGVQGEYKVKVCLKKQGTGVVCTKIQGIEGQLSFPTGLNTLASMLADSANLATYGAGSKEAPLALPVVLQPVSDGCFNLFIEIDANKLNLTGASAIMLGFVNQMGYVKPSKLEGQINIGHVLTHTNSVKKEKRSEGRDEKDKRNEAEDIENAKANSMADLTTLEQAQHAVVQQTEENLVQAAQYKSLK